MHYSDGTQAKLGDVVHVELKADASGSEFIGVLVSATSSSTTCNGQLKPSLQRDRSTLGFSHWHEFKGNFNSCFTISEGKKIA